MVGRASASWRLGVARLSAHCERGRKALEVEQCVVVCCIVPKLYCIE